MIFNIIIFIVLFYLIFTVILQGKKIKRVSENCAKLNNDIKTLLQNQNVLSSIVKELMREFKSYERNSKKIKKILK